jgi:hypothetical protein
MLISGIQLMFGPLDGTGNIVLEMMPKHDFFDATIQYQIDNNWSSESAVANSLRKLSLKTLINF